MRMGVQLVSVSLDLLISKVRRLGTVVCCSQGSDEKVRDCIRMI